MSDKIKILKIISKEKEKDTFVAVLKNVNKNSLLKDIKEKIKQKLKFKNKIFEFKFYDENNPIDIDLEEELNLNEIKLYECEENSYKIYILKEENYFEHTNQNEATEKTNKLNTPEESGISLTNKEDIKNSEEKPKKPKNINALNESKAKDENSKQTFDKDEISEQSSIKNKYVNKAENEMPKLESNSEMQKNNIIMELKERENSCSKDENHSIKQETQNGKKDEMISQNGNISQKQEDTANNNKKSKNQRVSHQLNSHNRDFSSDEIVKKAPKKIIKERIINISKSTGNIKDNKIKNSNERSKVIPSKQSKEEIENEKNCDKAIIEKEKTLFFFVITRNDCLSKIELILGDINNKTVYKFKKTRNILSYRNMDKTFYNKRKIERNIICYEVKIPNEISSLRVYLQYGEKNYENNKDIDLGDKSNLITIELLPFFNSGLQKEFIIFEESQKEKRDHTLLNCFIQYFTNKNIECKNNFINKYIGYLKNESSMKDFKIIFLLGKLLDNKFLEKNFLMTLQAFKSLKIKMFGIDQFTKDEINILYQNIHDFQNKDIISEDIWLLLIISLIKVQEREKVKEIFSLFEVLKNRENIIENLFSFIKLYINIFPEIKEYFVELLKFKRNEYHFIVQNIQSCHDYINLIEKNIKYITNKIFIFPKNIDTNYISKKAQILHRIINLIKYDENNIVLDTNVFKNEFKDYLKILDFNEKTILDNYLSKNKYNDMIIKEIKMDLIKNCRNKECIIKRLQEKGIGFDILEYSIQNIELYSLNERQAKELKQTIYINCKNKKEKLKIQHFLFDKIKSLEDLYKLWKYYRYPIFQENKEIEIQKYIEKFWIIYYKAQNDDEQKLKQYFLNMFHFIKENDIKDTSSEFLQKIAEINKESHIFLIYDNICEDISKLNMKDKKIIYNYLLSLSKFDSLIDYVNIIHFFVNYVEDKQIKVEHFYKDNNEINELFLIFRLLSKVVESKKNSNIQQINFFRNSNNAFNQFIQSINDKTINYNELEELNSLIENKNQSFTQKILFFKYEHYKLKKLYNYIKETYLYYKKVINKLKECLEYLENFPSEEDSKKKRIIDKKIMYSGQELKKFENSINEKDFLKALDKLSKRANKYNKMKKLKLSNIFLDELENRVDKEDKKLIYFENEINQFKKLLSIETINEIDKNIFLKFLSLFRDENELISEIHNLKSYFNFNEDTSIIEQYLSFELKKYKISQTLESIIEIVDQFNLDKTEFFNKITNLKEKIIKLEEKNKENYSKNEEELYIAFDAEILERKISKINEYISDFENFEINLKLKIYPIDIISFITIKFHENSLLKFLFNLTINNLRDITDSLAGSSLNFKDIDNYQMIKNIINVLKENNGFIEKENEEEIALDLKERKPKLKDIEFLESLPRIIEDNLYGKTIEEFKTILENCAKNQPKLLILFNYKKGFESSKEDIRAIINESVFEISFDENSNSSENKYNCNCIYKKRTKQKTLKELIDLQQLASLSQSKEENDENKNLNKFIDIIEDIKDIIKLIGKISYKGFPQEFYYSIIVNKGKAIFEDMKIQQNTIESRKDELKKFLKNINKFQKEAYKNKKFIKFFYGKQIAKFDKYLRNKREKSSNENEVSNLICYIIGRKYEKEPNFLYKTSVSSSFLKKKIYEKGNGADRYLSEFNNMFNKAKNAAQLNELDNLMREMYENVENYLNEVILLNKIKEEDMYKNSIIKNKNYTSEMKKGFFIINCINNNIYKQILKFYHCLVGNDPPRYSVLLCNEETTLEEIVSYIYLSAFCPYYSLFLIVKPDKLKIDIIYEVVNIIEKLNEDKKDIKSYILFLFDDIGKSEIGNELLKICQSADEPIWDLGKLDIISTSSFKKEYKTIEIVASIQAGLGKTFYIKKTCKEKDLIYVPFQIGGEVKRQSIMRRLEGLNLEKSKKYGLHLDFSDTKQKELFDDFLFSFLIQKFYSNNEKIFCYEDNVMIFIEIPNGFINFMDKFELLKEFSIHLITKLPKFELQEKSESFKDFEDMKYDSIHHITSFFQVQKKNNELNHKYLYKSDIQMVCNYLKFLGVMEKKNMYFYDLNEKLKEFSNYDYYCDSQYIDEFECNKLLNKYFNKKNRSYHHINIFIKVLADQLRKFSTNFYLNIEYLKNNNMPGSLRTNIIEAFIDLTSYFTIGPFDKIVSEQDLSTNEKLFINDFNENEEIIKASETLSKEESDINFSKLNDKALIFINNDGQSFTVITCAPKQSEIYKRLDSLFNTGAKFGQDKNDKKKVNIPDYKSMIKNEEFLEIIKNLVNSHEDTEEIAKKLRSYVFNVDNFFKMILILIRLRAGVPILIMGETGCGKTSLIKAIAKINNYEMKTLNIHAGITDNEIVQFMVKNKLLKDRLEYDIFDDDIGSLYDANDNESESFPESNSNISPNRIANKDNENKNKNIQLNDEKPIIAFFDEFNTCNSLGLLTEIMCSKKCQGIEVKKNVVFIGACNPYRKIYKKRSDSNALIKAESKNPTQNLIYKVNPLTKTQLYYILNFGSLSEQNEKKYIEGIVEAEIEEYLINKNNLKEVKEIMINAFMKAQSFIREKNGKESVSMRETRKFMTIYKFIIKDFQRKRELIVRLNNQNSKDKIEKNNYDYKFYNDTEECIAQRYSIATAIYICFYIRLSLVNDKCNFKKIMSNILKIELDLYPNKLQEELIRNIKLQKGIASNESLRLNLFICFIGILTRIAVFLVGPPGCSKTLCFNILKKEMKGHHSQSQFWKQYPQLVVTSYQGSVTSTSKGIIKAFQNAEIKLKNIIEEKKKNSMGINFQIRDENINKNDLGFISCVLIDEIGLCEISPFNPLKALHTRLELDYNNRNIEEKLAFVGISNWILDAAKMNRGIYLNVINPLSDLEQMEETALQITNIYDNTFFNKYFKLIKILTKSIFEYNSYLKDIDAEQINFHGARDFYFLIRTLTKRILNKNNNKEETGITQALSSIESNYNGIYRNGKNSSDWIKKKFIEMFRVKNNIEKTDFGIIECIKMNLNDDDSRYLLLIMKSNLAQYLVLKILNGEKKKNKIIYYLGSLFEEDIESEAYCAKALNKIKYYLEQDIVLILKNLSTTFASLYDLLNQRFNYIKNQKYAEITLGEVTNSAFVNKDLKIIVLIREEAVKMQDPPFLNRFEKYYISFDDILDKESKKIAAKFLEYRKLFKKTKKTKYNFENELINFYDEEIKSLISDYIMQREDKNIIDEEEVSNFILKKLSKTFPQEIIAFLNHHKQNKNFIKKVNEYYSHSIHSNFETYIRNTAHSINIIYTFTSIISSKKIKFEVNNEKFGIIKVENIEHLHGNLIRSERQFETNIIDFYEGRNSLLIIHLEESDSQNLEYILMFLERFEKEKSLNKKKLIVILIHLLRGKEEFNKDIFVPNLSGLEQTFVDNLSGKNISITEIMGKSIRELYNNEKLINIDELFKNELFICFQKIDYSFQDKEVNQNDYIDKIIKKILNDKNLMNKIKGRIIQEIEKIQNIKDENDDDRKKAKKEKGNIFDNIFENNSFESRSDFISLLVNEMEQKFTNYLTKFIVNSEKQSILSSLSKNLPQNTKLIWKKKLEDFNFFDEEINNSVKSNKIKVWTKIRLPCNNSIDTIQKIMKKDVNGYFKSYYEQEIRIRDCQLPSDIIENNDENEEIDEEKINLLNEFFSKDNNDIEDEKYEYVKEEINKFFVPKKQVINFIKNQIEKVDFIKSFESENREELLSLFFEDYYSQLLTSIIQSEDILYYKILKYLIELRFGKKPDNDSLEYYSKSILWIHIYKDEFIFIIRIFGILKEMFPEIDYLDLVENKINTKEIEYIISSHHPRHKKLIDKPFLLILDSIFYNLIELIEKMESPEVQEKLNYLSEIVQNGDICNGNLKLKSKDFYRFKTLFVLIKLFEEKCVYNKKIINLYISYIKSERKMLKENKLEQVSIEIENQLDVLLTNLPDCEEKSKTIMKILISKYKEITDLKCREILCEKILKDNHLIKISNEFFIHILDQFSFIPSSLDPSNEDPNNPFSEISGQNILLKKINEKNSKILAENLKYIFKFKIFQYYEDKLNKLFENEENKEKRIREEINLYLGEKALMYFKIACNTLIQVKINKDMNISNLKIKEIFCIVYCNIFLKNFSKYAISEVNLFSECREKIIKFLNSGSTENKESGKIKESFKLFILKELKSIYIPERTNFLNISYWTNKYKLKDLYQNLVFEKSNSNEIQGSLDYLFYGGNNLEEYLKEQRKRKMIINKYHDLDESSFLCNIDLFINEYLSTLKTKEGRILCQNSSLMSCFNKYITNNKRFSKSTKKLIKLFFDYQQFSDKLLKTIDNCQFFEILLYAYKFSIICSMANNNSIYSKMINENCKNAIKDSYIPGADLYCDLWVESYFNMYNPIKNFFGNGYSSGFYICDCGEYYFQVKCGVPIDKSYCANCHKEIGGLKQKLVIRNEDNGKYKITRIYPSKKNKNEVESRRDLKKIYGNNFEKGYPSKIFEDFEKEILDKMNMDYKGIFEQSYLFYKKETKEIRKLNQISFRLLNFIMYSNIYFSYKSEFLTLQDINGCKYLPIYEEKYKGNLTNNEDNSYNVYRAKLLNKRKKGINENDILNILHLNWELLKKELKEKNINICIFNNLLFSGLFDLIKNSGDMKKKEERDEFELKINELINQILDNYKNNPNIYRDGIKKLTSENLNPIYLFLEDSNINENIEFKYPYYYELLSIPTFEDKIIDEKIKSIKDAEKKYPVLCSYLKTDKKDIEYLQTFTQINNFVNFTIEKYSNEISRVKAQSIKIKDEINQKNIPKALFDEFLKGFNQSGLYKIATHYDCHDLKKIIRKLTKEDRLSDFLIDNGVQGYGMQLAALYQKYIAYQNSFLDKVIVNIPKKDKKLLYLKTKIQEQVNPQKANKFNIVSFDISTENYDSFSEMILFYSYKDSFDENFNYDFSKKDRIAYNLEEIEEQLQNLLLPGKKVFNNKIDFVIYRFEGFRSQNSSILATFMMHFPQMELNEEEKQKLYEFITKIEEEEENPNESKLKILFSLQIMIIYYIDRISMPINENNLVIETINDFPNYFKIPQLTKKLFELKEFKICHILSVYEYFELFCFNDFKNNMEPIYKEIINDEKKREIFKFFNENKNSLISKLKISTAIRRFISRSLAGRREDFEIEIEYELFGVLKTKEDCWDKETFNSIAFETEIEKLKVLNIKITEALDLYEILGGDSILLGENIKKKVEEKQEEEKEIQKKNNKNKEKMRKWKKKQIF